MINEYNMMDGWQSQKTRGSQFKMRDLNLEMNLDSDSNFVRVACDLEKLQLILYVEVISTSVVH